MKTNFIRLVIFCVAAFVTLSPHAMAQRQLGKKKGPTSKIYIAEAKGDTQIQNGDKVYTARQATAFDAPGTVLETREGGFNAIVYSNGTGMAIEQNTRVEINRFMQEPFQAQSNQSADTLNEPSVSQSDIHVARGAVGICTSHLVSGSSMNYSTPQASINIRGGKISIATTASETTIDLLEGDITIRVGSKDLGGQLLRPGERAVIRARATDRLPLLSITPIPPELLPTVGDRTIMACNARRTVTFEIIEKMAEQGLESVSPGFAGAGATASDSGAAPGTTQEIVVKPTVPVQLPINIEISPSRLPGG